MRSEEILKKFERRCHGCKKKGNFSVMRQSKILKRDKYYCWGCYFKSFNGEIFKGIKE